MISNSQWNNKNDIFLSIFIFSDGLLSGDLLRLDGYPLPLAVDGLLSKLNGLGQNVGNLLLNLGLIGEKTEHWWMWL